MAHEYRSRDSSINMVAQNSTACVCSRKQRRDETSQGTWDAWCRAKVHGKLTSKLYLAHRPNCPHVSSEIWGNPWKKRSYTAGIDAVIVDHQDFTRHCLYMHSGTESKHRVTARGGMVEGYDRPSCVLPLHKTGNEILTEHSMKTRRHGTYTSCKQQNASAVVRRQRKL